LENGKHSYFEELGNSWCELENLSDPKIFTPTVSQSTPLKAYGSKRFGVLGNIDEKLTLTEHC